MNATQLRTKAQLSRYFVILTIIAFLLIAVFIILFKTSNQSFKIVGSIKEMWPFV